MTTYRLTAWIPGHVPSVANLREHWAKRAKRAKAQRASAHYAFADQYRMGLPDWHKARVTLCRYSPRPLDSDNLVSCAKNFRDGVADRLGIKDNDPRVTWLYEAKKHKDKGLFIEIALEGR